MLPQQKPIRQALPVIPNTPAHSGRFHTRATSSRRSARIDGVGSDRSGDGQGNAIVRADISGRIGARRRAGIAPRAAGANGIRRPTVAWRTAPWSIVGCLLLLATSSGCARLGPGWGSLPDGPAAGGPSVASTGCPVDESAETVDSEVTFSAAEEWTEPSLLEPDLPPPPADLEATDGMGTMSGPWPDAEGVDCPCGCDSADGCAVASETDEPGCRGRLACIGLARPLLAAFSKEHPVRPRFHPVPLRPVFRPVDAPTPAVAVEVDAETSGTAAPLPLPGQRLPGQWAPPLEIPVPMPVPEGLPLPEAQPEGSDRLTRAAAPAEAATGRKSWIFSLKPEPEAAGEDRLASADRGVGRQ